MPIVEPEVLMDGAHSIEVCERGDRGGAAQRLRRAALQDVWLEGTLLKPNMVISGPTAASRPASKRSPERTVRCLKRTVPAAVPGIVFLSGGQSDEQATLHLNAMNKLGRPALEA